MALDPNTLILVMMLILLQKIKKNCGIPGWKERKQIFLHSFLSRLTPTQYYFSFRFKKNLMLSVVSGWIGKRIVCFLTQNRFQNSVYTQNQFFIASYCNIHSAKFETVMFVTKPFFYYSYLLTMYKFFMCILHGAIPNCHVL